MKNFAKKFFRKISSSKIKLEPFFGKFFLEIFLHRIEPEKKNRKITSQKLLKIFFQKNTLKKIGKKFC